MTKLLEEAVEAARVLSAEKQDEIAWLVLDTIGSKVADPRKLTAEDREEIWARLQKLRPVSLEAVRALYAARTW